MDTSTQGQGSWKCTICGAKSFENRKSYIRHRSYCRKAQARITTRKKACTNCTKAKTRCDLAQPHCSRCVSKSVACVYDSPSISSAQGVAPSTPSLQLAFSQSSNRRVRPSTDALSLNETRLSTEVSVTESLSSLDFGQIIPQVPEPFSIKKIANGQFSLNRSFVLCTLKSYPRMFHLRDLPPFIHPYYAYGNNTPGCQSATTKYDQPPLQNCAVIIRWHFVADEDQVMYVWRTMRVELERLLTEYEDYTDQDILAALQATTIYLLLRVSQEKYDAENFDIQLIHTMIKVAGKVKSRIATEINSSETEIPEWEDWILGESLRRTLTVLLLIDILFEISSYFPPASCDGTILTELPLPCGRALWRAATKDDWEKIYKARLDQGGGRENVTYADLMNFQGKEEGHFDHWLSGLDEFGTLVMAAASIQPVNELCVG